MLAQAINSAPPDRLRKTLHTLRLTSNDFARVLAEELLVTPRIKTSGDTSDEADSDDIDEDEDEDEEDDDDEESYEAGVITKTTRTGGWLPGPARTRYAHCINCEEEFDVTDNADDEGCNYHDGELEVEQDMFVDHDERCHGPMDTEQNRIDYPENFTWSCCEGDGLSDGCQTGRHEERERALVGRDGSIIGKRV